MSDDPIKEVLTSLGERIRSERRDSPIYQELAARGNLVARLRLAETRMNEVVFALVDVLKDVDEIEIDAEKYKLVQGLVAVKSGLVKHYTDTEGHAFSVDKAWQRIARELRK